MGSFVRLSEQNVVIFKLQARAGINIHKCHFLHCNGLCKEPLLCRLDHLLTFLNRIFIRKILVQLCVYRGSHTMYPHQIKRNPEIHK